jgi:hypothetical protein
MNQRLITIDGETKTLTEWCRLYDIAPTAVLNRIADGMTEELAITVPVRRYNRRTVIAETKKQACARLEREGRLEEFRDRQRYFRWHATPRLKRDEAFYTALEEFPPLATDD